MKNLKSLISKDIIDLYKERIMFNVPDLFELKVRNVSEIYDQTDEAVYKHELLLIDIEKLHKEVQDVAINLLNKLKQKHNI